jgi:hypothetical protein
LVRNSESRDDPSMASLNNQSAMSENIIESKKQSKFKKVSDDNEGPRLIKLKEVEKLEGFPNSKQMDDYNYAEIPKQGSPIDNNDKKSPLLSKNKNNSKIIVFFNSNPKKSNFINKFYFLDTGFLSVLSKPDLERYKSMIAEGDLKLSSENQLNYKKKSQFLSYKEIFYLKAKRQKPMDPELLIPKYWQISKASMAVEKNKFPKQSFNPFFSG